jgi:hypothetical protein
MFAIKMSWDVLLRWCGSVKECGDKAHQVLREELKYLGAIINQNLMIELE